MTEMSPEKENKSTAPPKAVEPLLRSIAPARTLLRDRGAAERWGVAGSGQPGAQLDVWRRAAPGPEPSHAYPSASRRMMVRILLALGRTRGPAYKSRSEIGSAAWSFLRVETASDGRVDGGEELELQRRV